PALFSTCARRRMFADPPRLASSRGTVAPGSWARSGAARPTSSSGARYRVIGNPWCGLVAAGIEGSCGDPGKTASENGHDMAHRPVMQLETHPCPPPYARHDHS